MWFYLFNIFSVAHCTIFHNLFFFNFFFWIFFQFFHIIFPQILRFLFFFDRPYLQSRKRTQISTVFDADVGSTACSGTVWIGFCRFFLDCWRHFVFDCVFLLVKKLKNFHFQILSFPPKLFFFRHQREKKYFSQKITSGAKAGDLLNRQTSVVRMLKPKCECEELATEEKRFSRRKFHVKMKILHDHGADTKKWRSQKSRKFPTIRWCWCARFGKIERMPTCCYTTFFRPNAGGLKLAKKYESINEKSQNLMRKVYENSHKLNTHRQICLRKTFKNRSHEKL